MSPDQKPNATPDQQNNQPKQTPPGGMPDNSAPGQQPEKAPAPSTPGSVKG